MNAPMIWIVFPMAAALVLWLLRKKSKLSTILGSMICLVLAILAYILPINTLIQIGTLKIEISSMLVVFGRRFILLADDRYLLSFVYAAGAFWFAGTWKQRLHHSFISLGLAVIAIMLAALSVEPFLYSALLFEIAVLVSIPLLIKPGTVIGKGTLRFLVFQSLGVPFILLAGWFLGGTGGSLSDPLLLNQAIVLLGLGFAFWLAVFPFHTWIPMMVDESDPYIGGFILAFFPPMILFILLDFINGITWIRESEIFFTALQVSGVAMIFTGGIWAAFQKNAACLFGYAAIIETGFALVAIGMQNKSGLMFFSMSLLPRILTFAILALSLTSIKENSSELDFSTLEDLFRKLPVNALGLVVSILSLAGLPLLANFSLRQSIFLSLDKNNPDILVWVIIGSFGFLAGGFRLILSLIKKSKSPSYMQPARTTTIFILAGVILLFIIGIAPGGILKGMPEILLAYPNLTW